MDLEHALKNIDGQKFLRKLDAEYIKQNGITQGELENEIARVERRKRIVKDGQTFHIDNIVEYCQCHFNGKKQTSGFNSKGIALNPPFEKMMFRHKEHYPDGPPKDIFYFVQAFPRDRIGDDCNQNKEIMMRIVIDVERDYGEPDNPVLHPIGSIVFHIDHNGCRTADTYVSPRFVFNGFRKQDPEAYEKQIENALFSAMLYVMFSIAMMHCKNVELLEMEMKTVVAGSGKKKLKDKTRQKKIVREKYYTLQIEPMKKVLSEEGNIEHEGLERALHICRGHFKTYDEKPLFGRVKGTFWVPQHMRGKSENGIIHKDYDIKLPTKEE